LEAKAHREVILAANRRRYDQKAETRDAETAKVAGEPAGAARYAAGGEGSTPEEAPGTPPAGKAAVLAQLEPADQKAYYVYAYAEVNLGHTTDRQAYEWLRDNGLPDERDSPELASKLAGYKLPPSFDTWSRQLRNARKALGEQKHSSRKGRPFGKSAVHRDEVDSPRSEG
jgi:hypothetical protein